MQAGDEALLPIVDRVVLLQVQPLLQQLVHRLPQAWRVHALPVCRRPVRTAPVFSRGPVPSGITR